MPIYEYQCKQCQERQEVIQSFSDAPLTECSRCGGEMRKLMSSPAIQFKGSGFYKTDYASAGSKAPETKSAGKSETKSDAAPAAAAKSEGGSESKSSSSTSSSDSKAD